MFFSFAKPLLNQILRNDRFDDNQLLAIGGGGSGFNGESKNYAESD